VPSATSWEDLDVWSVVIPVKRLPEAKTRLAPQLGDLRSNLALAFACDTVAAAAASPLVAAVYVVTRDTTVAARVSTLGAHVVADEAGGLNPAIEAGRLHALAAAPGHRVAALTADLPGLRTTDLTSALATAGPGRAFVADALGTGTTLLLSDTAGLLAPNFGPGSRRLHETSGATALTDVGPSLRQDVDTADDLAAAALLGLGAHTTATLSATRDRQAH
jgi:2-phospho-L-lactate guanylyltransferase